jgi:hypothetical protein
VSGLAAAQATKPALADEVHVGEIDLPIDQVAGIDEWDTVVNEVAF